MVTIRWSKEDTDELLRLLIHTPNATSTELADKHSRGVSRNSIISKLSSMGIKLTHTKEKYQRGTKAQAVAARRPAQDVTARPTVVTNFPGKFVPKPFHIKEEPHVDGGIDFEQLRATRCHWPLGGGPPFKFCGDTVSFGSYCRHHNKIAVDRSADRLQPRPVGSRSPTYVFRKRTG